MRELPKEVKAPLNSFFRAVLVEVRTKLVTFCDESEIYVLTDISDLEVLQLLERKSNNGFEHISPMKFREKVRKTIAVLILKKSVDSYSIKTDGDAVDYFNRYLKQRMIYWGLPVTSLNEISPNLSRTLREHQRYGEISV